MNKHNGFSKGNSTFTCDSCGRQTRSTGVQSVGAKVCPDCWELAGIHNAHQDGEDVAEYADAIRELAANIVNKGGKLDADFSELLEIVGAAA